MTHIIVIPLFPLPLLLNTSYEQITSRALNDDDVYSLQHFWPSCSLALIKVSSLFSQRGQRVRHRMKRHLSRGAAANASGQPHYNNAKTATAVHLRNHTRSNHCIKGQRDVLQGHGSLASGFSNVAPTQSLSQQQPGAV